MKLNITTLEGKDAGSVELSDEIFGLVPRKDLIQRCVNWQLAKRQAGTHKAQGRADVWRTGKKMYKQKGTGGARHGSARVPQFRGGGRAFGPVVRSHATDLPKKVRVLALKHALSAKAKDAVKPADLQIAANQKTVDIVFAFPRSAAFTLDDKEVEFSTKLGDVALKYKFRLKDMVYNGKLEL